MMKINKSKLKNYVKKKILNENFLALDNGYPVSMMSSKIMKMRDDLFDRLKRIKRKKELQEKNKKTGVSKDLLQRIILEAIFELRRNKKMKK